VLDPFGGTGTVALVAKALGRNAISVDLSGDYCKLAQWRCNDPQNLRNVQARTYGIKRDAPAVMPGQVSSIRGWCRVSFAGKVENNASELTTETDGYES
jgi:hypothetical protein